jgi:putative endonuclease
VKHLVYFEIFDDVRLAQQRERSLKKWPRDWKINLIERENLEWADLYDGLNN